MPPPAVLLARNFPRSRVAALVRSGEITPVRRGAYLETERLAGLSPHATERLMVLARVAAVTEQLRSPVITHTSAAAWWGLPLVEADSRVHVVQRSRPSSRSAKDVDRHALALLPDEVTEHHGAAVTTLERTVVDCAMTLRVETALILADAALHVGADLERCHEILARLGSRQGSARAQTVLEHADGGAESPGETRARLLFLRAGLPRPVTQVPIALPSVTLWADLGWHGPRLLAEYDGVAKYTARGSAADAVLEEKRREQLIVEQGYRVERVDRDDLRDSARVLARVRRLGGFGAPIPRPELNG